MKKRLIIFLTIAVLSIGLGFFLPTHLLPPVFHYSGYYFMLGAFVLWGALILDALKKDFLIHIKKHAPALLLAIIFMALIFHMSPPKFKILADETNLISISMAMHQNKTVSMPLQGLGVEYHPFNYDQNINPRPLLYPFTISLFHALIGYNPYNGMIVNFLFGIGILFLFNIMISLIFSRFLGIVAMILIASCPIFTFWVTSSGFETINLFFVIVVLLSLALFLNYEDVRYAELVIVSSVLLANCRYESSIFLFCLVILFPYFLKKELIIKYRAPIFCIPLFLLPLAWQRQIDFLDPFVYGDKGQELPENLFGILNFLDNLSPNVYALTGLNSNFGFLPLLFIAAVAGVYLLGKKFILAPDSISPPNRVLGRYIIVSGLMLFILYTSFFWGRFTLDIDNRLAMTMLPFIIMPAIYCLDRFLHHGSFFQKPFVIFLLLIQMLYYWPIASEQRLLKQNALHYINERISHYLYTHHDLKNEKILLISDRPNLFLIHRIGSIGFQNAVKIQNKLHYLENVYYDQILVLQKCNPITNEVQADNQLDKSFQLQKIARINVSPKYYLRISKASYLKKH